MNEKDYSAIKKGMTAHITVTVQSDSGRQVIFNDHSAC